MYVNEILKFIGEMQIHANAGELASLDKELLSELKVRFSRFMPVGKDSPSSLSQSPSQSALPPVSLTDEDYQFISECYKKRWSAASCNNMDYDYLVNPNEVNKKWVLLSKKLALCLNKSYLKVLMQIDNELDFHSSQSLLETYHIYNFFLGQNNALYRKRAFCNYLREHQYYLTILRSLEPKKISTLSIDELARFKIAKTVDSEFVEEVTNKKFASFWEFLKACVFPNLQSKSKQSPELLLKLFFLIEQYFTLKHNNSKDFAPFKKLAEEFFALINDEKNYSLEEINYFYGNKVISQKEPRYLLEFLIDIKTAKDYSLDEQLHTLLLWLQQYNPALRSIHAAAKPSHVTPAAAEPIAKKYTIIDCKNFILSLFVINFDPNIFEKVTINLWDKTNLVWRQAENFYSKFKALLNENKDSEKEKKEIKEKNEEEDKREKEEKEKKREKQLLTLFTEIMKNSVIPHSNTGFLAKFTPTNPHVETWFRHAKDGTWGEMGVHWFEPERILHALRRINTIRNCFSKNSLDHLTKFADEIIHTYSRKQSSLLKEFRINILFTQIMKTLSPTEQRYFKILVYFYPAEEAKSDFTENCNKHIFEVLSELNVVKANNSRLFPLLKTLDSSDLFVRTKSGPICDLVENYKFKLGSSNLNLSSNAIEKMGEYLNRLSSSIVSIDQEKQLEAGAANNNYLGDNLLY